MTSANITPIYETIADIAYAAGAHGYYSGDSRADMQTFIWWAQQFEKENEGVVFGEDGADDYMDCIDAFIDRKLNEDEPTDEELALQLGSAMRKLDKLRAIAAKVDEHSETVERYDRAIAGLSEAKDIAYKMAGI